MDKRPSYSEKNPQKTKVVSARCEVWDSNFDIKRVDVRVKKILITENVGKGQSYYPLVHRFYYYSLLFLFKINILFITKRDDNGGR